MKIIKKIEIKNFRSIYKANINIIEALNIFAGSNDSGKTNLLKALNLFFNNKTTFLEEYNFEKDYSKLALLKAREKEKGQQFISIRIYFNLDEIKGKKELKEIAKKNNGLWVERRWWRYEQSFKEIIPPYITTASSGIKRSFSIFVHSIKFVYIPAFKNEDVFSYVMSLAGNTEGALLDKKAKEDLDKNILNTTCQLSKDFSDITAINTKITLPITLESFWSGLQISSDFERIQGLDITLGKTEDYLIDFASRGEGIKSIFIPVILKWLADFTTNAYWIWGIDEPENSIESIKSLKILNKFVEYSKNAQIFASSHSPIFIFPQIDKSDLTKENKITVYITSQKEIGRSIFELILNNVKNTLKEHQKDNLHEIFGSTYHEMLKIQQRYSEEITQKDNEIIKINQLLNGLTKPVLFVEDEYIQIYQIAFLKLQNCECNSSNLNEQFEINSNFCIYPKEGATRVAGLLNSKPIIEWSGKKVIGLFDFDEEGFKQFKNSLKKENGWSIIFGDENKGLYKKHQKHPCFYGLLLPVPDYRNNIANKNFKLNYLSVELLLTDDTLKEIKCFQKYENIGCGANVPKLKIEKSSFWKKLFILQKDEFQGFSQLFFKINELFNSK